MSDLQPNQTREEPPCDFLTFLAERWGLEAAVVTDALGKALAHYEPGPVARARGATPPLKARAKPARAREAAPSCQAAAA